MSIDINAIIVSLHKESSLDANYPKGHGTHLLWIVLWNHTGEYLFHIERSKDSKYMI